MSAKSEKIHDILFELERLSFIKIFAKISLFLVFE